MEDPEMADKVALVFVGTPGDFVHGYPPTDIEVTEAEADELTATTLYERKKRNGAAAPEGDPA